MPNQARSERKTQNRVISLFTDRKIKNYLGYNYLGDWSKNDNNQPIITDLLKENLQKRGYTNQHISAAIQKLLIAADSTGISLYQANMRTYQLLRYGIPVQIIAGETHQTVKIIDWENPLNNDFGIAEEVTLKGNYERRPDLVIYINGIAISVIELKRSSVEVAEGIRQLITNQEEIFNKFFFSTIQLLFAGNDSQGLYYGTTKTEEKLFVKWKDEYNNLTIEKGSLLDKPLLQIFDKIKLLDLIYQCIIFDAGRKKVPRQHQYLAFKAAQERIREKKGGVIWHTQGSGKSILMIMLAKWIKEYDPSARILVVTDRDELDQQIEEVMINTGLAIQNVARIKSRADLVSKLVATTPSVMCALLHKFDPEDLKGVPPKIHGQFYVFVDECHRTQGGDMNVQMKRWLSGATFIGFTGTPLLKSDKQTTSEVFGTYIHTYKFHQAVEDKVILDLKYESRDVPQRLGNRDVIDSFFTQRTKGLNDFQKAKVRKSYATLEKLMSSSERKQRIIASIIEDFNLKPRLNNNRGTAILVTSDIYDACDYFRLFQNEFFAPYVGIITSYEPNHNNISREPPNSNERLKFDVYTKYVLKDFKTTEKYEKNIKESFINEPANTKLLIVVSKLLTGFDAPSCTYIYLDNELRDHNLFQAICRTNRLDGEDKNYGYIVDFKNLFKDVQNVIAIYNSDELANDDNGKNNNIELKDNIKESRRQLDITREILKTLCTPVKKPQEAEQYFQYFCGDADNPESLINTEPLRISFYKAVAGFIRTYSEITLLSELGYLDEEINIINKEVEFYSDLRLAMKKHAGEELDIKPFEADMRHLINTYVQADPALKQGDLNDFTLTELIIKTGIHNAIAISLNEKNRFKLSKNSIAEGIINNIRKTIIQEKLTDPVFYNSMSLLLDVLITKSRQEAKDYEEFLREAEQLIKKLADKNQIEDKNIPLVLHGKHDVIKIYNNLLVILNGNRLNEKSANIALEVDRVMREKAPAGWRNDQPRESVIKNELFLILDRDREKTNKVFELIKNQRNYL
jgi:type I restriction enzyme R subunit